MRLTLSRKAIILVTIPLVFEIVFVAVLVSMLQQVERERLREAHAHEVAAAANQLLQVLLNTGTTSVVYHITGNRNFKERFRRGNDEIRQDALKLKELVQEHPNEKKAFDRINTCWLRFMDGIWEANLLFEKDDRIGGMKVYVRMQKDMDNLFGAADALVKEQQEIERQKSREQARTRKAIMAWIAAGVGFNIFLAFALLIYFNRGTSRRMQILMENLQRIAANQPLGYPVGGGDEIGMLDKTLRRMVEELAEARRKEQAVIDNAVDVICSIDRDGRFRAVNLAAREVWGREPEALLGKRLSSLVVDEDQADTLARVQEIMTAGTKGSFENRIKHTDGSIPDMQWSVHWSASEQALFCVVHDISERKRIDRLKRDFVAMVSHDLRTPLTSLSAFLELLSTGAYGLLNSDGKRSLSISEISVERLINLVNALLDIDKMESGSLDLHLEPVSMNSLIERSIASTEGFADQQEVKIVSKIEDDAILTVDADRIVQVIVNLLGNAIKFSPKGETVDVISQVRNGCLEISVCDRGRGVSESMRDVIFERYRQVERDDERIRGGSGLGLAICKAIIDRHGGKIGVASLSSEERHSLVDREGDSEHVLGSRFWFSLPLDALEASCRDDDISGGRAC